MLVNIMLWVMFGAMAGWVASIFMNRDAKMGTVIKITVGIVGAILGGFLMTLFGVGDLTGFNPYSVLVAALGAIGLLFLVSTV